MPSLASSEFLLARITDDEWRANRMRMLADDYGDAQVAYEWVAFANRDGSWERAARMPNHATPARILAECEAKRRIVDRLAPVVDYDRDRYIVPSSALEDAASATLRLLTLPYADHPDYRQEWKP